MSKATTKKYLILLAGMGDRTTFVVGPAGWAYIHSDYPTFPEGEFSLTETLPQAVIDEMDAKLVAEVREYGEGYGPEQCEVTTGSWDNDRAIHLSSFYKQYDRVPRGPWADQYDGCLY